MRKKRILVAAVMVTVILAFFLTACGQLGLMTPPEGGQSSPEESGQEEAGPEAEKGPTEEELRQAAIAERAQLEESRRQERGEFYVPLPGLDEDIQVETVKAKALYVTAHTAGFPFDEEDIDYYADYIRAKTGQSDQAPDSSRLEEVNRLEEILAICQASEINGLVIDVKNDDGQISWDSDVALVQEIGATRNGALDDFSPLMDYMQEKGIYSIARIVAFKDPYFAKERPQHAIQLKTGGPYRDRKGIMWVNPFDTYVWDYNVAVSQEAALRGFDEIQYDYVRFPANAAKYNPITEFPGRQGRDKDEAIEDFLAYASDKLEGYGVHVAADVFGVATKSWDDKPEDIGQTWRKIANECEYICPMIYPSHYGPNWYGFAVPDQHPYGVLRGALKESLERNAAQKNPAIIRPWVQGFNAPWVKGYINYDAATIAEQMIAGAELGVDEYIIWDPGNSYDYRTFFYQDRIGHVYASEDELDIVDRTAEEALKRVLSAQRHQRYRDLYLLTPIEEREEDYDDMVLALEALDEKLLSSEIVSIEKTDQGYTARLNAKYESVEGKAEMVEGLVTIKKEKEVYKVSLPKRNYQPEEEEPIEGEAASPAGGQSESSEAELSGEKD